MDRDSTSKDLVALLWLPTSAYGDRMRQQAERFNTAEPRFIIRLVKLCNDMGEDRALAKRSIRDSLMAGLHTESEDREVIAQEIIRNALWEYSLGLLDEYKSTDWNRSKGRYILKKSDAFIRAESPELCPDIFSDSLNTIRSYCQSVGIAAYVLAGDTMQESMRKKTMAFVEWVGEDTHRLNLARRCKRINPEDLNELESIMRETPTSLDEGVL